MKQTLRVWTVIFLLFAPIGTVCAAFIGNSQGGTDFPEGGASFADQLVDYSPVVTGGNPTTANSEPARALGLPDYVSGGGCTSEAECTFVSLGSGGSLTLRFIDNVLTGSGDNGFDLWIFEVGPDVEDTFVAVSINGLVWHPVGKMFGSTAGVDLDIYGFGPASRFTYVRLTDDPDEGDQVGISVGADIDAVGAISTLVIPEPATLGLAWAISVFAGRSTRSKRFICA